MGSIPLGVRHAAYLVAIFVGGGLLAVGKLPGEPLGPIAVWLVTVAAGLGASFTRTPGDGAKLAAAQHRIDSLTLTLGHQVGSSPPKESR